jgi:peptide chain release factor subunit 1
MNPGELHELFSRPERPHHSVLSVYLDVDQSHAANLNRGFETQLKDTLASLQSTIHEPAELERFARSALHIKDFVSAYQPGGRVLALFFDETDGFFRHIELDETIPGQAWWDHELFLQPLAGALKEFEHYGIVLVDRNNLRLFTVFLGHIEEHVREDFGRHRVRHIKAVGMDHLGSASRVQRKADERVKLNLRHVIKMMDWLVAARKPSRLILAGTPEVTAELRNLLPKRLDLQVMGAVDVAMEAPVSDVLAAARPVAEEYERDAELQRVNEVVTTAAKNGKAVVGLGHTLKAVNSDRVWELIYSEDFHAPGFECSRCTALFSADGEAQARQRAASSKASCQYCGGALQPVGDVVERVLEHALRGGAKVDVVTGEASASLDSWGGIGAFLKTRTGTVRI